MMAENIEQYNVHHLVTVMNDGVYDDLRYVSDGRGPHITVGTDRIPVRALPIDGPAPKLAVGSYSTSYWGSYEYDPDINERIVVNVAPVLGCNTTVIPDVMIVYVNVLGGHVDTGTAHVLDHVGGQALIIVEKGDAFAVTFADGETEIYQCRAHDGWLYIDSIETRPAARGASGDMYIHRFVTVTDGGAQDGLRCAPDRRANYITVGEKRIPVVALGADRRPLRYAKPDAAGYLGWTEYDLHIPSERIAYIVPRIDENTVIVRDVLTVHVNVPGGYVDAGTTHVHCHEGGQALLVVGPGDTFCVTSPDGTSKTYRCRISDGWACVESVAPDSSARPAE